MEKTNFNWRINHQIKAPQVRLIGKDGKQIGVVSLQEALSQSQKEELDLVEIAPNAKPPVAKIVNIGKFRYEEEKKARREQKKAKPSELKEVRVSPFIAEHDFSNRFDKIKGFLEESNKVKVVVVFTGRQMNSKDFGYAILKRITSQLGDSIVMDMPPKFLGRHLVTIISPLKKSVKKVNNENAETKN